MVRFRDLHASLLLALLVSLSGCSQVPPGLDFTLSFNLDPVGIGISVKNPPRITASGPDGFAITTPTTTPAATTNPAP